MDNGVAFRSKDFKRACRELPGKLVLVGDQADAVEHRQAARLRLFVVTVEHVNRRERQVLGDRQLRDASSFLNCATKLRYSCSRTAGLGRKLRFKIGKN